MKRKLNGSATAAVMVFVVSTALAGVLGVRQVERISNHLTWVARVDLVAGTQISRDMLQQQRISNDIQSVSNPRQLVGKLLLRNKDSGEPFMRSDLQNPPQSRLAQRVPPGRVLYTLAPKKGAIPHTQLRSGDVFDVLASGPAGVRTVARDVRLMGTLTNKPSAMPEPSGPLALLGTPSGRKVGTATGPSLVVAVHPADVYPLASIAMGEVISLVLHGAEMVENRERPSISPQPTHRQIEVFKGLKRKTVHVRL